MQDWNVSTWIALLALVVSLLSFVAAAWASYIGHQSLAHARKTYDEQLSLSFERERSQLLQLISQNQSVFEKNRLRVSTLQARINASPQPVRELLHREVDLLTGYLPQLDGAIRQCSSLWHEAAEWNQTKGIHALVHHQARYRALMEEDQVVHQQGLVMVDATEDKLAKAHVYVSGATR